MANIIRGQRLIDSTKRNLTKITIVSDGTNEANTTIIDVSSLAFALNTTGKIMTSNVDQKSIYKTTIKRIVGSLKANVASIRLQWHGAANSEIITSGAGWFDYNFDSMIDGGVITNPETASIGDILITTQGLQAGDVATLIIDLRKDGTDYDAGQSADKYAFNRG